MIRKLMLLFFVVTATVMLANAQKISGKIVDRQTGEGLPDASVVLVKTGKGIHTSEEGSYELALPAGKQIIEVRYIGYAHQRKEIQLGKGETLELDFRLVPETVEQEQVVVTANKLGMDRDNVPMNVSVITRQEIEQSTESNILPVISAQVPGLFVTERGVTGFGLAGGSAGKISIRGVGGSDASFPVLLLIDGQPQFMGIMGHAIPDSYVSSDIEKVEVVKGPASILYGTNAMGGALNLITRRQKEEGLSLRGRLMYGSFNTQKYAASAGFRQNRFSVLASYNHDQTDGDRPNSDFKIDNGYLKVGYEINGHFSLTADVSQSWFDAYDPGSIYYPNPAEYDHKSHWVDISRTNSYVTLSNKFEKAEGGLKVYYMKGDHDLYDGWKSTDQNVGLSLYQGLRLFENNLLNVGFDAKRYGGKGTATSLGELSGKWLDVKETGAYAIVQHTLFERLTFNSGIRYDHHSLYGGEWIPQFGAAAEISKSSTLKASASKGFRNPTIRELYLFPPANAALQPETMWNYELTFSRTFAQTRGKAELTGFVAKGENLILAVPNSSPPPPVKNQNTGAFTHQGVELDVRFRVSGKLSLHGSYSYLHMDTPKVSSPEHQLFGSANYRAGKFDLSASLHHINNLYTKVTDPVSAETYTLLNAKTSYLLTRQITLFVSGENLFDQKYQAQYGYPMPGITLFTGINFSM